MGSKKPIYGVMTSYDTNIIDFVRLECKKLMIDIYVANPGYWDRLGFIFVYEEWTFKYLWNMACQLRFMVHFYEVDVLIQGILEMCDGPFNVSVALLTFDITSFVLVEFSIKLWMMCHK